MTAVIRGSTPRWLRIAEYRAMTYRRLWKGTIVSAFVTPVLFLLAIGVGLGTLVDEGADNSIGGVEYVAFVAPALLATTAMQAGMGEATYPVLASVKWIPTAFGQIATPIRPIDVFAGHQAWTGVRLTLNAAVFAAVIVVGGLAESWWVVAAPFAAALCGLAFSVPIAAWAIGQRDDFAFPLLLRFVILPAFLFSGTFFPIEELPVALRVVAVATPLWHGVSLCRSLALGTATLGGGAGHLAVMLAFIVVGFAIGARRYQHRLIA